MAATSAERQQHHRQCGKAGEVNAGPQPAVALVETAGAVGLRYEVSSPSSRPMPKTATVKNTMPPSPTAPMASGASQPTMIVSTTPMNIQPSSAMMTGQARRIVGPARAEPHGGEFPPT